MVLVHYHCQKYAYHVWSHLNQMVTKLCCRQKMPYKIKGELIKNGTRKSYCSRALLCLSLIEACIPSLESFEPKVTKLHSGQEIHLKVQRGMFLCHVLPFIVRSIHTEFEIITCRTYGHKVMLRTEKSGGCRRCGCRRHHRRPK